MQLNYLIYGFFIILGLLILFNLFIIRHAYRFRYLGPATHPVLLIYGIVVFGIILFSLGYVFNFDWEEKILLRDFSLNKNIPSSVIKMAP